MTPFLCETCGTQHAPSAAPPAHCLICEDERQYVGPRGQRWITLEELAGRHGLRAEDDAGLLGIGTGPGFAIDQRAIVLPTERLRILWECISLITPEAVARVRSGGPVQAMAISHPHFYSSMVEWSEALGNIPVYLHEADREWVMRPSPNLVFWSGDELELAPGVSLIRLGGHFEGSTGLHWRDAARPEGALFPGDALQVVADRRHVSFMYSYPNYIPMRPAEVRALRERLGERQFADVYGYTWGRNIIGDGRAAVDRSFRRYLEAVAA